MVTGAFVHFPLEIFERIFAFACTDDGTTGRSLSMVSRSVHHISKAFKYYSIAITGPRQAVGFAELMESFPSDNRHVPHLFVSNRQSPLTVNDIGPDPDCGRREPVTSILRTLPSRLLCFLPENKQQREWNKVLGVARGHARGMDRLKTQSREQDELTLRTLLRILEILAPNLKTLSVFFESRWLSLPSWEDDWQPTFPSLPALTDLTVTYRALVHAEWSQWRVRSAPVSLPSLRRLDLSGVDLQYSYSPFHCYRCITTRTPSLTHLCIPSRTVHNMKTALAENRPEFEEDLRGILPSNLEYVFIQLAQPSQFTCCGSAERYADDCAHCHSLAAKDERFYVLKADRRSDKSHGATKQEWLDRIDGGEGSWDVNDRITTV